MGESLTNLNEKLEIDIIGFGRCSFGLLALTSSDQIDPLCAATWK